VPLDRVQPLRREHIPVAARVLAAALSDDPGYSAMLPDVRRRIPELTAVYRMTLADALKHGRGVVTTLGDVITGAAAVYPPGTYPMTTVRWGQRAVGLVRLAALAREHSAALSRFGRVTSSGVPTDAWYVEALGVRPDLQRLGRGRLLIDAVLAMVDEAGDASYLETTNPANVDYYALRGYVRTEARMPVVPETPEGPWILPMWRPSAADRAALPTSETTVGAVD